jgi:hypothetical protein
VPAVSDTAHLCEPVINLAAGHLDRQILAPSLDDSVESTGGEAIDPRVRGGENPVDSRRTCAEYIR